MNYLAHLYLSYGIEEIMVGNYIADAVKGRQIESYPQRIQDGIRLHRKIDEFTDYHELVNLSKARIRTNYRKYAGVVVDMYYDHFLASNWSKYSEHSLKQFTSHCYKTLFKYYPILPVRMKRILPMMAAGNWLYSYAAIDNIGLALQGMARRTKNNTGFEHAGHDLRVHYKDLSDDFGRFFPELIHFTKALLNEGADISL